MSDPFRNFNEYKIDPLREVRNAGIVTSGDVFWVSNPSDDQHRVRTDNLGRAVVKVDIQAGIDATKSDNNDYVMVIPQDANAVWTIGTALDVNEDRVHLLSVGYTASPIGYGNTIQGFATTAAGTPVDASMVDVTGAGVEIAGFNLFGTAGTTAGGTVAQLLRAGSDGLYVHDMVIQSNDSAADTTMVDGPGTTVGARFENVHFAQTGTANAPDSLVTIPPAAQRWEFVDCTFYMHTSNTADEYVTAGTGPTYYTRFTACEFINSNIGTLNASAVQGSTTVDDGVITMSYCTGINVTQFGSDPSAHIAPVHGGTRALLDNPGLAVGSNALVAA